MKKPSMKRALTKRALQTGRLKIPTDWTVKDGVCNSSEQYLLLVDAVSSLIRSSAHQLIAGDTRGVAGLIVAYLAHRHGMKPRAGRRQAKKSSRKKGAVA